MDSQTAQSSGQSDNTFVSKVKGLLVRAWRERWNEIQWGISMKKVIATAPSGYNTGDIAVLLLQQALVGSQPNNLILSYVKHAVLTKLIPSASAFKYIYSYEEYRKPYCLLALVNLAKDFGVYMSYSSADGGLTLCHTLQSLLHWLLKVMLRAVQHYQESGQTEYQNVLHAATLAADAITESSTVNGLLYVAQCEDSEIFCEMEQLELNVRGTMSQIAQDAIAENVREDVSNLNFLKNVKCLVMPPGALLDVGHLPICPTVITMVALEAVLNPTSDMQPFVDQLFVLEKLMKLPRPYLFCELFRACFMGLIDLKSVESQEQYRWCAFTFLKIPQILQKMQQQQPSRDFSADLEEGFNKLLYSSSMLDQVDIKHNCDLLSFLLGECSKISLISESQQKRIQQKRSSDVGKSRVGDQQSPLTCAGVIIRAETTFNSILKTLDADYTKNQESLFGVLHHMLSGKKLGHILASAAATGKLQIFCFKLIKITEFAKQSPGEGGKAAQTRALLFDISFLMLCHIIQVYGTEMIMSNSECMDSFFVHWALRCFPEDGKYKSVDNSMPVDTSKVDALLNALTSGNDVTQGSPKWHEVCTNLPWAIQEVLFAWEHGSVSSDNIKMILNHLKSRMLCLPIVVSAWLCSYINTLSDEARTKPLSVLQQLIQPVTGDSTPQYYSERSHLMHLIVQKMIHEILPASKRPPAPQYIPPNTLPGEVMSRTLQSLFAKGWMDLECLRTLEALLNLCGSDWFADRLVLHMLDSYRVEDMNLNLSLMVAVSHIDLEPITLSLLLHTVPNLLLSADKHSQLTDPKGYTLAKYCVYAVTAAQTARSSQKDASSLYRRSRKRSRKEFDLDDVDESQPQKRTKTMEPQITLDSDGFNFDFLDTKEESDSSPVIDIKDPLNKALMNLFRLMNAIVQDGNITPKTSFVISFIDEAIRCGQYSRYILQFMPPNMLSQIQKCIPAVFDNEKILQICDLTTATGRKIASKAICQNARYEKD